MKRLTVMISLLLTACIAASCSSPASSDSTLPHGPNGSDAEKLPYIADYADRSLSYTVTVSDGVRTVTLDVMTMGNVTEAAVTSPEGLAGIQIVCDAAGLRMRTPYSDCRELIVSGDAAAGLTAVLEVMKTPLGQESFDGGKCFSLTVRDIPVHLELGSDGIPKKAQLGEGLSVRSVTFEGVTLSKNEKNE